MKVKLIFNALVLALIHFLISSTFYFFREEEFKVSNQLISSFLFGLIMMFVWKGFDAYKKYRNTK